MLSAPPDAIKAAFEVARALRTSVFPPASVVVATVAAKLEVAFVEVVTAAAAPHSTLSSTSMRGAVEVEGIVDVVVIWIAVEVEESQSVDVAYVASGVILTLYPLAEAIKKNPFAGIEDVVKVRGRSISVNPRTTWRRKVLLFTAYAGAGSPRPR